MAADDARRLAAAARDVLGAENYAKTLITARKA
jgi:hypothetical protein